MKKRKRRRTPPLPILMAEMTFSSWETITRRGCMMASGQCSAAEYQRMVLEKMQAAQQSGLALMRASGNGGLAAAMAPWHKRAGANAKRLRKK